MSQQHCHFDASRSLTALEQDSTIIAVIEMSQSNWLVAALVPGVARHPLKKLDAQEEGLLKLLHRCEIARHRCLLSTMISHWGGIQRYD
jgi:hypothetical protein